MVEIGPMRGEMKKDERHHDLHVQCGVLLLDYVFEKFRNNSFKSYGFCASHFKMGCNAYFYKS